MYAAVCTDSIRTYRIEKVEADVRDERDGADEAQNGRHQSDRLFAVVLEPGSVGDNGGDACKRAAIVTVRLSIDLRMTAADHARTGC